MVHAKDDTDMTWEDYWNCGAEINRRSYDYTVVGIWYKTHNAGAGNWCDIPATNKYNFICEAEI